MKHGAFRALAVAVGSCGEHKERPGQAKLTSTCFPLASAGYSWTKRRSGRRSMPTAWSRTSPAGSPRTCRMRAGSRHGDGGTRCAREVSAQHEGGKERARQRTGTPSRQGHGTTARPGGLHRRRHAPPRATPPRPAPPRPAPPRHATPRLAPPRPLHLQNQVCSVQPRRQGPEGEVGVPLRAPPLLNLGLRGAARSMDFCTRQGLGV